MHSNASIKQFVVICSRYVVFARYVCLELSNGKQFLPLSNRFFASQKNYLALATKKQVQQKIMYTFQQLSYVKCTVSNEHYISVCLLKIVFSIILK